MNDTRRRFKLTIGDLLLFTFGSALAVPCMAHYPYKWGSWFWIAIFSTIVCCCIKQIQFLIVGKNLPFDSTRWDIRAAWIAIRTLGVLFLSAQMLTSPDNEFFRPSYNSNQSDLSLVYSNAIVGTVVGSIGPIGFLFCVIPLFYRTQTKLAARTLALVFICIITTILFLGSVDAAIINQLILIATTGIEFSMVHPGEMAMGLKPESSFNWTEAVVAYGQAVNRCILPACVTIGSLFLISVLKTSRLRWLILLVCLVANYWLASNLIGVLQGEFSSLNGVSNTVVVMPNRSGLLMLGLFCGFCGCLIAFRSTKKAPLHDSQQSLTTFLLPPWLLITIFTFGFLETWLMSQMFGFWRSGSNWFSPSEFSPVMLVSNLWYFVGGFFLMVWLFLVFLSITRAILDHFALRKQESGWGTSTRLDLAAIVPALAWGVSLVPITLFLKNLGLASLLDHRPGIWEVGILFLEGFWLDLVIWPSLLLLFLIACRWIYLAYFKRRNDLGASAFEIDKPGNTDT